MKVTMSDKFKRDIGDVESVFSCQPMDKPNGLIFSMKTCYHWGKPLYETGNIINNSLEQEVFDILYKRSNGISDFKTIDIDMFMDAEYMFQREFGHMDAETQDEFHARFIEDFDKNMGKIIDQWEDGDLIVHYDCIVPLAGWRGYGLIRDGEEIALYVMMRS